LSLQFEGQSFAAWVLSDTTLRCAPTFRVLYLDVVTPRELVGIATLDPSFAPVGVQKIFQWTALGDQPVLCYDTFPPNSPSSPQTMVLGYGGTPHMAAGDDCAQDLFHTNGTNFAEVHVLQSLRSVCPTAPPGTAWYVVCTQMPSILLANLAWLDSMQKRDGTGLMWNTFPTTLRTGSVNSTSGTELGLQAFFSLYNEVQPYFSDATPVKVNYDGSTKPLETIVAAAQDTADHMVSGNYSPIWLPQYLRAQALRNGLTAAPSFVP